MAAVNVRALQERSLGNHGNASAWRKVPEFLVFQGASSRWKGRGQVSNKYVASVWQDTSILELDYPAHALIQGH